MRNIFKGDEPRSLERHRLKPHSSYENYPHKDELRGALAAEQQQLCCYCMQRIKPEVGKMKIEHWRCQANHPDRELDYRNLLGACLGGEGQPFSRQHCDTRKGNMDLLCNPAERHHAIESKVQYDADGAIWSSDPTLDAQLNEVLNLNLAVLKRSRKHVLDGVLEWWRKERDRQQGPVPKRTIKRVKDRYGTDDGKLLPFCQVAVWWLNQKL